MSMPSNNLLTSRDPYQLADRAFGFDWSRSAGKQGRWWNEEIYSGMSRGGVTWKKQSDPRELTTLVWMTLAHGASGAMFWQHRPEYLSFESPGYNLVALDGEPTPRFAAATRAIRQIDGLREHLPLECPRAEVGIVYHSESQELFGYNDENERFLADLRGVYRTLWTHGVPADVGQPEHGLVGLPVAVPDQRDAHDRRRAGADRAHAGAKPETRLVAEGSFGIYQGDGQSSYGPPEGLAERLGVRVADFSAVTDYDIEQGRNVLQTPYGAQSISSPCGYAVLEPLGDTRTIATLDGASVAVQTSDGRFTWYGLTLSAGFGDVGQPEVVQGLLDETGIEAPVAIEGDPVVPVVRRSQQGGWLVFVFNLERATAHVRLRPRWPITAARDLLAQADLAVQDNAFHLSVDQWEVAVVHCPAV